jgi:hypothetical protein
MLSAIVTGGQTGVDRGALDAAASAGLHQGGWCPKGRKAEDGTIPDRYPLRETVSSFYRERTLLNVRDSDGTLVLTRGVLKGGTRLTAECARKTGRPYLIVDLDEEADAEAIVTWIRVYGIRNLNVAGPRESVTPGIGEDARRLVAAVIDCDRRRTPAGS